MKITASLPLVLALAIGSLGARAAVAHEGHEHDAAATPAPAAGKLVQANEKNDAAWLAKARASYPLATCAVSGDKLEGGSMGLIQDFIYKVDGQPDRLVRFCCKDCIADFNKEPAKFLKMIDDAAAAKPKPGK